LNTATRWSISSFVTILEAILFLLAAAGARSLRPPVRAYGSSAKVAQ
jgi:hypothetical protein